MICWRAVTPSTVLCIQLMIRLNSLKHDSVGHKAAANSHLACNADCVHNVLFLAAQLTCYRQAKANFQVGINVLEPELFQGYFRFAIRVNKEVSFAAFVTSSLIGQQNHIVDGNMC